MPDILRIPKVQLAATLVLIAITAFLHSPSLQVFYILLLSLGSAVLFDLSFTLLRKKTLFIPYAAIVSGLIIGLLTDPQTTWYRVLVITAMAMGVKNFLRIAERHIFNPAASGLVIGGVLFHQMISWWGVSFQTFSIPISIKAVIFFIILLLPLLVSAWRMQRFNSILWFFVSYSIVLPLVKGSFSLNSFATTLLDPTIIFFSSVMLPEPMTSPVDLKRQILYGFFVTVIVYLLSFPEIGFFLSIRRLLPDPLLLSLLMVNLFFFRFR